MLYSLRKNSNLVEHFDTGTVTEKRNKDRSP